MVQNIIPKINLKDSWRKINLNKFNSFYLIAIKENDDPKDTIKASSIKKIRFEIGIDCGLKNQPLTIQYLNIDFNDMTSGNNEINKIAAFTRCMNLPMEFYIKIVSLDDGLREIKDGETSISININTLDLGK